MKRLILLMCLPFIAITTYGKFTETERRALDNGAHLKVVLKVVDDQGIVVENASVAGNLHMNNAKGNPFEGRTDKNGIYTISGKCVGTWHYFVFKDGYYKTFADIACFSRDHVPVSNDRWQPYGATNTVVLKRIIDPIPMAAQSRGHDYSTIPAHDVFIGYDLEVCDWIQPYGKGKTVDFEVKLEETKIDRNDIKDIMSVRFTNCLDGAYIQKQDSFSRFKSAYSANTNAAYAKEFVFVYDSLSVPAIDTRLPENEYMIVRVRTAVDEDGNLVKANYGKIYGVWQFIGGTMGMASYFNPTTNDTNLEFDPTKNLLPKKSQTMP